MTSELASTGSTSPPPPNVRKFAQPAQNDTKIWQPPKNRTLPNFNPPKCAPRFYGLLMFIFLPSLDLSLISGVPYAKIKVISQFSVHLLRIPSLHYLAEIGLHLPGSLKEQFWTLSG